MHTLTSSNISVQNFLFQIISPGKRYRKKLALHVISCLRCEQLQVESLLKLPSIRENTGDIWQNTADPSKSTPIWKTSLPANEQSSSQVFLPGYGSGITVLEIKSAFKRSQTRSRKFPRSVNWLENKVPSLKQRANTFYPSSTLSKVSGDYTPLQPPKWLFLWMYQKQKSNWDILHQILANEPQRISQILHSTISSVAGNIWNGEKWNAMDKWSERLIQYNSESTTLAFGRTIKSYQGTCHWTC